VGDDLKIRKSRKPRGDVFGQAVGQSFEVHIAARPPERSTATQKPSPARAAPESGAGVACLAEVGVGAECDAVSRQCPETRCSHHARLNAVARIFFQAAADHAVPDRQADRRATSVDERGLSRRIDETSSADEVPSNGRRPVAISCKITPREKISVRWSSVASETCSGTYRPAFP